MLKELRKYISCIYDLCNGIADLDLIFSFVQYSKRSVLTRPTFGSFMDIKNSRHPILDFVYSTTTVPNDIVSFLIILRTVNLTNIRKIELLEKHLL